MNQPPEEYEVEECVLSRREPDLENRIVVYDSPTDRSEVEADESLQPGTYILQEVKSNGVAWGRGLRGGAGPALRRRHGGPARTGQLSDGVGLPGEPSLLAADGPGPN